MQLLTYSSRHVPSSGSILTLFLSAITKLQKATIASSCLSVQWSACIVQLSCHRIGFHEIWYSSISWKYCQATSGFIKSDKNNDTLCEEICVFVIAIQSTWTQHPNTIPLYVIIIIIIIIIYEVFHCLFNHHEVDKYIKKVSTCVFYLMIFEWTTET